MPRGKRANGEGSVFKGADGKWNAVITVGRDSRGRMRRRRRTAKSRADASALLREMLNAADVGLLGDPSTVTVEQFAHRWLDDAIKPNKAASTYDSYQRAFNCHILPRIGRTRLEKLSALHVEAMFADMARAEVGARTRENAYVVFRSALSRAVQQKLIASNPCDAVVKPLATAKKIWPFTAKESRKIIAATKGNRLHALYLLAFMCGVRQGELFGLEWEHVDLEKSRLRIENQAVEVAGRLFVGPPKTESSKRTIELPPRVVTALAERRKGMLKEGRAGSPLVFCGRRGAYLRRGTFRTREWKKLLSRIDIEYRGFHHVRHTYATLSLGAGVPVHVVAKILGHARPSTTLNIYAHVLEQHQSQATETITELLG